MASNTHNTVTRSGGLSALVVLTLCANALIVGFIYHYHQSQLEESRTQHTIAVREQEQVVLALKEEIRLLEGVPTWEETTFASYVNAK